MKHLCKNCREIVDVNISFEEEMHILRAEVVVYEKELAHCSKCNSLLDIEEVNDRNSKKVLDASEVFNVLCPFD